MKKKTMTGKCNVRNAVTVGKRMETSIAVSLEMRSHAGRRRDNGKQRSGGK